MKLYTVAVAAVIIFSAVSGRSNDTPNDSEELIIRTYGIKLNVEDMPSALSFYGDKLGFKSKPLPDDSSSFLLEGTDDTRIILSSVKNLRKQSSNETRLSFTLQVNDLDKSIAELKSKQVEFGETEPRKEAVGNAIYIKDPSGRLISLMHQTIVKAEPFDEPRIYNYGFRAPDMNAAREFYEKKLGFVARSEKYLPKDLPLGHTDNSFAFMLHYRENTISIKDKSPDQNPYNILILQTANLESAKNELTKRGVVFLSKTNNSEPDQKRAVFEDPFGNVIELWEIK